MRGGLQEVRPGRDGEDQLQGVQRHDEQEEVIHGSGTGMTMHAIQDIEIVSVSIQIGRRHPVSKCDPSPARDMAHEHNPFKSYNLKLFSKAKQLDVRKISMLHVVHREAKQLLRSIS